MTINDAQEFMIELNKGDPFGLERTDAKLGVAIGWLWREIEKYAFPHSKWDRLTKHMSLMRDMHAFLMHQYTRANPKFSHDDQKLKKLITYCFAGMNERMNDKVERVSNEMQQNIILGCNMEWSRRERINKKKDKSRGQAVHRSHSHEVDEG